MRYSTTTGLVLAAFSIGEVVAGPAHAHAHLHKKMHEKKDVDWSALDWNNMGIDWSAAYEAGLASKTAAAVVAATTVASVAAETTAAAAKTTAAAEASSSSSSSSGSSGLATLWNDLVGISNGLKSFGTAITAASGSEVSYIGNIGSPQGSNIIKVSSRDGYDYTNEFINTSGQSLTVVVWNKAYSRTGHVKAAEANLGACVAPVTPILTFALAPGESQIVAFQENSQIGWSEAVSDIAESGAYATTWGEANFVSTGSGYDVSAIMNVHGNKYNMAISSTEVSCVSDMTQNFWLTDSQPIGDSNGSCYIPGSTVTLTTKMGGSTS